MIHYHNFDQGSDEWLEFKKGKLSASKATPIAANGSGLKTYCKELALESIGVEKDHYVNDIIDRGTKLEPSGRMAYEFEYSVNVKEIGCISNDKYNNVVISPDGLINDDGGCEIKARNNIKHFSLIIGEKTEIPYNQIQMSLLISERKWWDFISFNPNLTNPLFVKRIYPDLEYFEKLKIGFIEGNKLIKNYINKYNNYECK